MAGIGRNDPCPCGSGKKYKKCCLGKAERGKKPARVQKPVPGRPGQARKPDQPSPGGTSSARLDEMMRRGFLLIQQGQTVEGCRIWLEVWEHLKKRFTPQMKDVLDADSVFQGSEYISNFCMDLEMELGNAGHSDREFHRKRIAYCSEFCRLFPKTDPVNLHNMKRAVGESYFALGMAEEGEKAFQALVREFPDNAWSYIGWGDAFLWPDKGTSPDYEKAERIYRLALEKNIKQDRDVLLERLEDLRRERGRS